MATCAISSSFWRRVTRTELRRFLSFLSYLSLDSLSPSSSPAVSRGRAFEELTRAPNSRAWKSFERFKAATLLVHPRIAARLTHRGASRCVAISVPRSSIRPSYRHLARVPPPSFFELFLNAPTARWSNLCARCRRTRGVVFYSRFTGERTVSFADAAGAI